ncbi:hypothetical protein FAI40_03045 [Acetobacteraceae bacterium]|nr:hypothetical protein FAI40_03045 [Acetobacteraceae bacterium]
MTSNQKRPASIISKADKQNIEDAQSIPKEEEQKLGRALSTNKPQKTLESRAQEAEFDDDRKFAWHVHYAKVIFLYAGAFACVCILLVWLLNLLGPDKIQWLSDSKISSLGNMVGAIVASFGANKIGSFFFKK